MAPHEIGALSRESVQLLNSRNGTPEQAPSHELDVSAQPWHLLQAIRASPWAVHSLRMSQLGDRCS